MSSVKKRIEELDLMDDFLFTEATTDPETAPLLLKMIIERAVGLKVERLIIEPQKTVNGVDTDSRGIRMDVTAREVTDVEGNRIQITHGNYISLIENKDRNLRKEVFRGLYGEYKKHANSVAAMFQAQLKKENFYGGKYVLVRHTMHQNILALWSLLDIIKTYINCIGLMLN